VSASPTGSTDEDCGCASQVGLRIAIGRKMPCHAFTLAGVLLLARGERVLNEVQLERLCRPDVLFSDEPPRGLVRVVEAREQALGMSRARRKPAPPDHQASGTDDQGATEALPEAADSPEQWADTPASAVREERPSVPFEEEIVAARSLRAAAIQQVGCVLDQVRANRPVDVHRASSAVDKVLESLLRNERAFASMLRLKRLDDYTFTHSVNCCVLSMMIARHSGVKRGLREIGLGGLLHDIGKVRLPAEVLQKPDRLTQAEWDLTCRHPASGAEIIARSRATPGAAIKSIRQHHERLDGSGYPEGLAGDAVSLPGRVAAVADVYDAMTSERAYRPAIPAAEVMRWIRDRAGSQFDPGLVGALVSAVGVFPVGTAVRLRAGELGVVADLNPQAPLRPIVLVISDPIGLPFGGPCLVDLSSAALSASSRDIVGTEDPAALGIDVDKCLALIAEDRLDAVRREGIIPQPLARLSGIDVTV
jgi:HD-GYP domain-containing protein (c-di-GMP phosphodiesterase class II)